MRRPLLIEDPLTPGGDAYYNGPLGLGILAAHAERHVVVTRHRVQVANDVWRIEWRVEFHDDPDVDSPAEWGSGPTDSVAWRFALGAMLGPLDAEYDEEALVKHLLLTGAVSLADEEES